MFTIFSTESHENFENYSDFKFLIKLKDTSYTLKQIQLQTDFNQNAFLYNWKIIQSEWSLENIFVERKTI